MIGIAPAFAPGWAALGAVLIDIGEIDRSVDSLQRSLGLADNDDVRSNLDVAQAVAYRRAGRSPVSPTRRKRPEERSGGDGLRRVGTRAGWQGGAPP